MGGWKKATWRRIVALTVPFLVVLFAAGFFVALEVRRGPDWRLELKDYVAGHAGPSETVAVEEVAEARRPGQFRPAMGVAAGDDWIRPSAPVQEVRCVLLRRSGSARDREAVRRQIVFLVYHSDALYRVGWLAYEGPEEPFGERVRDQLDLLGCDLGLE